MEPRLTSRASPTCPPRGIGKVTLLKMLSGREQELTGAVREKVAAFRRIARKNKRCVAQTLPPSQLMQFVITESGMERCIKKISSRAPSGWKTSANLLTLAARYDQLPPAEAVEAFLESAALASDQDELKENADAVRLMTVHASKGLEFPYVFITGLEEGLFPYEREEENEADREEERRLMYVALTRAREKSFLVVCVVPHCLWVENRNPAVAIFLRHIARAH